jgi:hypothetical protein
LIGGRLGSSGSLVKGHCLQNMHTGGLCESKNETGVSKKRPDLVHTSLYQCTMRRGLGPPDAPTLRTRYAYWYYTHTGTFPCSISFSLYFFAVPTPVCVIYANCSCPFYFSTPNDHVSSLSFIPPAYLLKLNSELFFLLVMFLYVFPSRAPVCVILFLLSLLTPNDPPVTAHSISVMRPAHVFRSLQVLYCTC